MNKRARRGFLPGLIVIVLLIPMRFWAPIQIGDINILVQMGDGQARQIE